MKIDIQKLQTGPLSITLDHRPKYFNLESDEFEVRKNITGALTFSLLGDKVLMTGDLHTIIRMECSRCLEPVDIHVDKQANLLFMHESEKDKEEILQHPNGQEVTYFNGKILCPDRDIRELVLIELPDYPKCRESCRGLCPSCGKNLNRGECSCEKSREEIIPEEKSWKKQIKKLMS